MTYKLKTEYVIFLCESNKLCTSLLQQPLVKIQIIWRKQQKKKKVPSCVSLQTLWHQAPFTKYT